MARSRLRRAAKDAVRPGVQPTDLHGALVDAAGRLVGINSSIASLGGATLDNEENYLIKKLFTAAGAIQIENQARI